MRPLSAAQLLEAWEQGLSEPTYRRALPLLAAAFPDSSIDAVASLSVGERDRWLLILREWTFGSQLASVANCSACNERVEWMVNAADLYMEQLSEPDDHDTPAAPMPPQQRWAVGKPGLGIPGDELSVEVDRYCVTFRVPNTSDLAALTGCADITTAHSSLLERCVLTAQFEGIEKPTSELPNEIITAIVRRMAEADPQADLKFDLTCPACGREWQAVFDIEAFFWSEIHAWAQRILSEVHLLASAYGWRELDILNLSPWRRQFYIGLASV